MILKPAPAWQDATWLNKILFDRDWPLLRSGLGCSVRLHYIPCVPKSCKVKFLKEVFKVSQIEGWLRLLAGPCHCTDVLSPQRKTVFIYCLKRSRGTKYCVCLKCPGTLSHALFCMCVGGGGCSAYGSETEGMTAYFQSLPHTVISTLASQEPKHWSSVCSTGLVTYCTCWHQYDRTSLLTCIWSQYLPFLWKWRF